jgi:hypothetical protein
MPGTKNSPISLIYDIAVLDSNNIVVLGGDILSASNDCIIRKSSDGGNTWQTIRFDTVPPFYSIRRKIFYPKKDFIFIACDKGEVLYTNDAGKNWNILIIDSVLLSNKNRLSGIQIKGNFVIAKFSGLNNYKSLDYGLTWKKFNVFTIPTIKYAFGSFNIIDSNNIFIAGLDINVNDTNVYYFKSSDRCQTWNFMKKSKYSDSSYLNFNFCDSDYGFNASYLTFRSNNRDSSITTITKTLDGGLTWSNELVVKSNGDIGFDYVKCLNRNDILLGSIYEGLIVTRDGGRSWKRIIPIYNNKISYSLKMSFCYLTKNKILFADGGKLLLYQNTFTDFKDYYYELIVKIYPNPASDYLYINKVISENVGISFEIYNIFGAKISTSSSLHDATPQEGNLKIDVSNLLPGVYFIKIGDSLEKFIKL